MGVFLHYQTVYNHITQAVLLCIDCRSLQRLFFNDEFLAYSSCSQRYPPKDWHYFYKYLVCMFLLAQGRSSVKEVFRMIRGDQAG